MECLHSFCKRCIVKFLETSCNCPVCHTEIHKTRPLLHVRPDPVLQDIVYKLVPSLYDDYHKAKQELKKHLLANENSEEEKVAELKDGVNGVVPHIPDPIYVTLEHRQRNRNKNEQVKIFPIRYLRCPSAMPVKILKKFLRTKFFVKDTQEVEVSRSDEVLFDHLTLKEVARIYGRYGKLAPLDLNFDVLPKACVQDLTQNSLTTAVGVVPNVLSSSHFSTDEILKSNQTNILKSNDIHESSMTVDTHQTMME
ncbi:polycomb complex protein BMI-1-like isoform X2 [Xenia sp. Carnegie-2017]|nr:polycomb complex protein BMI-1-like isoform X2 [Xenia sp. Carnegie-2017]XP_046846161.1 polycomb complex protein BMI-1-like isoform X2 [Xenia sp. Carnegie-2017]XP_046846162.1 polycomb complex protein BMI-1-like isoform X2 [Xenia sp. Carnegie-2017]XP_046846163.1 polycomb complex protein BMI-1-like isoform X2 [Xenia sp. Carnegie-2017]